VNIIQIRALQNEKLEALQRLSSTSLLLGGAKANDVIARLQGETLLHVFDVQ